MTERVAFLIKDIVFVRRFVLFAEADVVRVTFGKSLQLSGHLVQTPVPHIIALES